MPSQSGPPNGSTANKQSVSRRATWLSWNYLKASTTTRQKRTRIVRLPLVLRTSVWFSNLMTSNEDVPTPQQHATTVVHGPRKTYIIVAQHSAASCQQHVMAGNHSLLEWDLRHPNSPTKCDHCVPGRYCVQHAKTLTGHQPRIIPLLSPHSVHVLPVVSDSQGGDTAHTMARARTSIHSST
jgi:hypothetical protein